MPKVHFSSLSFLSQLGINSPPQTADQIRPRLRRDSDFFDSGLESKSNELVTAGSDGETGMPCQPSASCSGGENGSAVTTGSGENPLSICTHTDGSLPKGAAENMAVGAQAESYTQSIFGAPIAEIVKMRQKRKAVSEEEATTSTAFSSTFSADGMANGVANGISHNNSNDVINDLEPRFGLPIAEIVKTRRKAASQESGATSASLDYFHDGAPSAPLPKDANKMTDDPNPESGRQDRLDLPIAEVVKLRQKKKAALEESTLLAGHPDNSGSSLDEQKSQPAKTPSETTLESPGMKISLRDEDGEEKKEDLESDDAAGSPTSCKMKSFSFVLPQTMASSMEGNKTDDQVRHDAPRTGIIEIQQEGKVSPQDNSMARRCLECRLKHRRCQVTPPNTVCDRCKSLGLVCRLDPPILNETADPPPPPRSLSLKGPRKSKRCARCRKSHLRCAVTPPNKACDRCIASGLPCVFDAPSQEEKAESLLSAKLLANLPLQANLIPDPPIPPKLAPFKTNGLRQRPSGKWSVEFTYERKRCYFGTFDKQEQAELASRIAQDILRTEKGPLKKKMESAKEAVLDAVHKNGKFSSNHLSDVAKASKSLKVPEERTSLDSMNAIISESTDTELDCSADNPSSKEVKQLPSGNWQVAIEYQGKERCFGTFDNRDHAVLASKVVREKLTTVEGSTMIKIKLAKEAVLEAVHQNSENTCVASEAATNDTTAESVYGEDSDIEAPAGVQQLPSGNWQVRFGFQGRQHYFGSFKDLTHAILANEVAREKFRTEKGSVAKVSKLAKEAVLEAINNSGSIPRASMLKLTNPETGSSEANSAKDECPAERAHTSEEKTPPKNMYRAASGRWRVEIGGFGKKLSCGTHDTQEQALEARNIAREMLKQINHKSELTPEKMAEIIKHAKERTPGTLSGQGDSQTENSSSRSGSCSELPTKESGRQQNRTENKKEKKELSAGMQNSTDTENVASDTESSLKPGYQNKSQHVLGSQREPSLCKDMEPSPNMDASPNKRSASRDALTPKAPMTNNTGLSIGNKSIRRSCSGKWRVDTKYQGTTRYFGTFETRGQAELAYTIILKELQTTKDTKLTMTKISENISLAKEAALRAISEEGRGPRGMQDLKLAQKKMSQSAGAVSEGENDCIANKLFDNTPLAIGEPQEEQDLKTIPEQKSENTPKGVLSTRSDRSYANILLDIEILRNEGKTDGSGRYLIPGLCQPGKGFDSWLRGRKIMWSRHRRKKMKLDENLGDLLLSPPCPVEDKESQDEGLSASEISGEIGWDYAVNSNGTPSFETLWRQRNSNNALQRYQFVNRGRHIRNGKDIKLSCIQATLESTTVGRHYQGLLLKEPPSTRVVMAKFPTPSNETPPSATGRVEDFSRSSAVHTPVTDGGEKVSNMIDVPKTPKVVPLSSARGAPESALGESSSHGPSPKRVSSVATMCPTSSGETPHSTTGRIGDRSHASTGHTPLTNGGDPVVKMMVAPKMSKVIQPRGIRSTLQPASGGISCHGPPSNRPPSTQAVATQCSTSSNETHHPKTGRTGGQRRAPAGHAPPNDGMDKVDKMMDAPKMPKVNPVRGTRATPDSVQRENCSQEQTVTTKNPTSKTGRIEGRPRASAGDKIVKMMDTRNEPKIIRLSSAQASSVLISGDNDSGDRSLSKRTSSTQTMETKHPISSDEPPCSMTGRIKDRPHAPAGRAPAADGGEKVAKMMDAPKVPEVIPLNRARGTPGLALGGKSHHEHLLKRVLPTQAVAGKSPTSNNEKSPCSTTSRVECRPGASAGRDPPTGDNEAQVMVPKKCPISVRPQASAGHATIRVGGDKVAKMMNVPRMPKDIPLSSNQAATASASGGITLHGPSPAQAAKCPTSSNETHHPKNSTLRIEGQSRVLAADCTTLTGGDKVVKIMDSPKMPKAIPLSSTKAVSDSSSGGNSSHGLLLNRVPSTRIVSNQGKHPTTTDKRKATDKLVKITGSPKMPQVHVMQKQVSRPLLPVLKINKRTKWQCDFCHIARFDEYEEALQHELICKERPKNRKRKDENKNKSVVHKKAKIFSPKKNGVSMTNNTPDQQSEDVIHAVAASTEAHTKVANGSERCSVQSQEALREGKASDATVGPEGSDGPSSNFCPQSKDEKEVEPNKIRAADEYAKEADGAGSAEADPGATVGVSDSVPAAAPHEETCVDIGASKPAKGGSGSGRGSGSGKDARINKDDDGLLKDCAEVGGRSSVLNSGKQMDEEVPERAEPANKERALPLVNDTSSGSQKTQICPTSQLNSEKKSGTYSLPSLAGVQHSEPTSIGEKNDSVKAKPPLSMSMKNTINSAVLKELNSDQNYQGKATPSKSMALVKHQLSDSSKSQEVQPHPGSTDQPCASTPELNFAKKNYDFTPSSSASAHQSKPENAKSRLPPSTENAKNAAKNSCTVPLELLPKASVVSTELNTSQSHKGGTNTLKSAVPAEQHSLTLNRCLLNNHLSHPMPSGQSQVTNQPQAATLWHYQWNQFAPNHLSEAQQSGWTIGRRAETVDISADEKHLAQKSHNDFRHQQLADVKARAHNIPPKASWYYYDLRGAVQGPFTSIQMRQWHEYGHLKNDLFVSKAYLGPFRPLLSYFPDPSKAFMPIEESLGVLTPEFNVEGIGDVMVNKPPSHPIDQPGKSSIGTAVHPVINDDKESPSEAAGALNQDYQSKPRKDDSLNIELLRFEESVDEEKPNLIPGQWQQEQGFNEWLKDSKGKWRKSRPKLIQQKATSEPGIHATSSGKWSVKINFQGKQFHFGTHETQVEAVMVNRVARGILKARRESKVSDREIEEIVGLVKNNAYNSSGRNENGKIESASIPLVAADGEDPPAGKNMVLRRALLNIEILGCEAGDCSGPKLQPGRQQRKKGFDAWLGDKKKKWSFQHSKKAPPSLSPESPHRTDKTVASPCDSAADSVSEHSSLKLPPGHSKKKDRRRRRRSSVNTSEVKGAMERQTEGAKRENGSLGDITCDEISLEDAALDMEIRRCEDDNNNGKMLKPGLLQSTEGFNEWLMDRKRKWSHLRHEDEPTPLLSSTLPSTNDEHETPSIDSVKDLSPKHSLPNAIAKHTENPSSFIVDDCNQDSLLGEMALAKSPSEDSSYIGTLGDAIFTLEILRCETADFDGPKLRQGCLQEEEGFDAWLKYRKSKWSHQHQPTLDHSVIESAKTEGNPKAHPDISLDKALSNVLLKFRTWSRNNDFVRYDEAQDSWPQPKLGWSRRQKQQRDPKFASARPSTKIDHTLKHPFVSIVECSSNPLVPKLLLGNSQTKEEFDQWLDHRKRNWREKSTKDTTYHKHNGAKKAKIHKNSIINQKLDIRLNRYLLGPWQFNRPQLEAGIRRGMKEG